MKLVQFRSEISHFKVILSSGFITSHKCSINLHMAARRLVKNKKDFHFVKKKLCSSSVISWNANL